MTGSLCALGIDPGGTSGLFLAAWKPGQRKPFLTRAWQCGMDGTTELAGWILAAYTQADAVGIEAFDSRRRGKQLAGFSPAKQHELIQALEWLAASRGIPYVTFAPGMVKPWLKASGDPVRRLREAGLYEAVGKMRDDALDAAGTCLYTACARLGVPDPLSRAREDA